MWLPFSLFGFIKARSHLGHSFLAFFFVILLMVPQASIVVSGLIVSPQKIGLLVVLGLALAKVARGRTALPRHALLFIVILLASVMTNLAAPSWSGVSGVQFLAAIVGISILVRPFGGEKLFTLVDYLVVPVIFLGLAEYVQQTPLFINSASESLSELGYKGLDGRMRDDHHRIQLLFHAPFLAAELLLFQLIIVIFSSRQVMWKLTLSVALVFLIVQTESRGALIVLLLVGSLLTLRSRLFRSLSRTRVVLIFSAIVIAVGVYHFAADFYAHTESIRFEDEKASSLFERADQFRRVVLVVGERPILGRGPMRNVESLEQINHMDNFYLRFLIEFGLAGLLWFLALGWKAMKGALSNPKRFGLVVVFFSFRFLYQDPTFLVFLAPLITWDSLGNVDYTSQ